MSLSPPKISQGIYRPSILPRMLQFFREHARWVYCISAACWLTACDPRQGDRDQGGIDAAISNDLIWSYMVNDSAPDARIQKWNKSELRSLIIVDQSRADFFEHFAPLLRQVGESIDVKIDVCQAITKPGETPSPSGPDCEGVGFDFYFVVTNGAWRESDWQIAQLAVQGRTAALLTAVRELPGTESRGKTCQFAVGTSKEIPNQIETAIAVVDFEQPIVLGRCGTDTFLSMMGLQASDGDQPLDPSKEGESLAEFLLKQTPYGAGYLLRILYSPDVRPDMQKSEFLQKLAQ